MQEKYQCKCKNVASKLLALTSIFTLTFSNFAFVGKSYASNLANVFGSGKTHENVLFDAVFVEENNSGKEIESSVNNESLSIDLNLEIKKEGYLRDAKIEFLPKENGKLNFEIDSAFTQKGKVESVQEEVVAEIQKIENETRNDIDNGLETDEKTVDNKQEDEKEIKDNSIDNDENENKETEILNGEKISDNNASSLSLDMEDNNSLMVEKSSVSIDLDEEKKENNNRVESTSAKENDFNSSLTMELEDETYKGENQSETLIDSTKKDKEEKNDAQNITKYEKFVENFKDDSFYLKQLGVNSNVQIEVPIKYRNEKYVDKEMFSNYALIKLSGTYIDGEGKEHEIEEIDEIKLSWKDERTVKVSSLVNKYIDYGEGVILQTLVKVDNSSDKKTMPVCESNVEIEVPKIMGSVPEKINVAINKLEATNGETNENNSFSRENWKYYIDDGKIEINVQNKEMTKNYYDEEQEGIKKQDYSSRYYNGSGEDEYLITYIYPGIKAGESIFTAKEVISTQMKIFDGSGKNGVNTITAEESNEFILEKQNGDIVSLDVQNITEDLSKAYFYANYAKLGTYDLSIASKYVLNIANKGLIDNLYMEDVQNFYIDKSGNSVDNNDLSYKEIVVSKANFDDILGENGEIKIYNAENMSAEYGVINKKSMVDSNGDISFYFGENVSKVRFEISTPINEGNLVIKSTKGLGNLSISKDELLNMNSILTRTDFDVKYSGIEEVVNLGTKNTMTNLLDTRTKANLVITKDRLSTLTKNENVDIKIELNNDEKLSDLYGHSEFEIEYPSHVESIEVVNTSLLYGEGLDISYIKNENRKIIVAVDGVQKELNSGRLTHGTNIVITANITVDEFTPAMYESFKMNYSNNEATEYYENGVAEAYIKYLSPSGLVCVNTMKNYKDDATILTSVKQGTKKDAIGMYQDKKKATMELLIMNNNSDDVEDVKIIGKYPYKGMKDSLTNEDMGNTQDIEVSPINVQEGLSEYFKIYYSEEENPTEDLDDISNKWTSDFKSISKIKSYLIVPTNKDYKLYKGNTIKFDYDFIIPANLGHGEKIVGMYKTICKNAISSDSLYDTSYPDIVYIGTEEGPELEAEISVDKEEVYENEEIYMSVFVRNKGSNSAKNLNLCIPIPDNASYVSYYTNENQDVTVSEGNSELNANMIVLESGKDLVFDIILKADAYKNIKDDESNKVKLNVSISASELGSVIKAESPEIKIKKAEIVVTERNTDTSDNRLYKIGSEIPIGIQIKNISKSSIDNLILEKEIPKGFKLDELSIITDEGTKEIEKNEENEKIIANIGNINSGEVINLKCLFKVEEIEENLLKEELRIKSVIKVNDKEYSSNEVYLEIAKSSLEVSQETDSSNTYIRENDVVTYVIRIKNVGKASATGVSFEDTVPPGMTIISYDYTSDGIEHTESAVASDKIFEQLMIRPDEEVVFKIKAQAQSDIDSYEKSVSNIAKVNSQDQGVVSSNTITHIIEKQETGDESEESTRKDDSIRSKGNVVNKNQEENISKNRIESSDVSKDDNVLGNDSALQTVDSLPIRENIERTYKISGYIWEDNNQNGIRENGEGRIDDYQDMRVKLVNAAEGVIENEVNADDSGYYVFQGVKEGEYYILLDYNTRKYGITTYKKEGISDIVNSDIIASKVEENGIEVNKAITDKLRIKNQSISNIDMGLFYAEKFDLEIDNTVTQIMVQTPKGMKTSGFENVKLAKEEIAASELNNATVYIEYTMKVKNNGDVSGYAKKIVDYISGDMEFNSSVEANKGWFSGTDGNVYSTQLANVELKPGETREIKIILQKKMTEENTGIVSNQVEIASDYNIYGIADIDSIAGNNIQAEDDMSNADAIITIETGEKIIYSIFIVIGVTALSIGGYVGYKKLKLYIESKKEKEEEE